MLARRNCVCVGREENDERGREPALIFAERAMGASAKIRGANNLPAGAWSARDGACVAAGMRTPLSAMLDGCCLLLEFVFSAAAARARELA